MSPEAAKCSHAHLTVFLFAVISIILGIPQAGAAENLRFSEIMYHPVEEPVFDSQGYPVLDLTEDLHEFLEIYNAGSQEADLHGWRISGDVSFEFPAGFRLAAGGFAVIARNPVRLASVPQYGLKTNDLLGPYNGQLGNHGGELRLRNPQGQVVDSVSFSPAFPWAIGADALGAADEWTGIKALDHQYCGRSLERVSYSWPGNDPANWVASPLSPGPSPGRANSLQLAAPRPVVIELSAVQADTGSIIVRSNQPVQVSVKFSATNTLSNVSLEYFVDDVALTNETRTNVPLIGLEDPASGRFQATIPGQLDRKVIRYRILADRGAGVEAVSPRADDPFGWHAYFITPVRNSTNAIYDVFISSAALNVLATNISQSPRRITLPDPPGTPRQSWNATQPAIFVHNGKVYDIRMRYHGSRYNRSTARRSYKYQFPRYAPFNGRNAYFETDKGEEHRLGSMLYDAAGLPIWRARYVSIYQNTSAVLTRLEQEEMDEDLYLRWMAEQSAKYPDSPRKTPGDFYKAEGVVPFETGTGQGAASKYENSGEGPYYIGNEALIPPKTGWTVPGRYNWTFPNQTHGWKGGSESSQMIAGLWKARGDLPTAPKPNLPTLRDFLLANFDIDSTLTYIAIRNWSAPFDNATHNHLFWRDPERGWSMSAWDLDGEFANSSQSIYWDEQATPQPDTLRGPNWLKDSFLKAFRNEFRQKLFILNNTLLSPTNLTLIGARGLVSYANARRTSVNTQLALGAWYAPQQATNFAPLNGSAVFPGASLATLPYSHGDPAKPAHATTTWLIRSETGAYNAPIIRATTSSNLASFPIPFGKLTWGQLYYWRAFFTDTNGHPGNVSVETSFLFGAPTNSTNGILLNEVLAENAGSVTNGGDFPDYIELVNTTAEARDLSSFSLTDNVLAPGKYFFPLGTTIPAGGFLTIWCDDATNASGLHSGFAINKGGQTVALFAVTTNGYALADALTFGPQIPDFSIGRLEGGWALTLPTPNRANQAATLGRANNLKINEWMASDSNGPDWFELFNPEPFPVALGGLNLSNDGNALTNTVIPSLSFIPARGFEKFIADKDPEAGPLHTGFKLAISGDSIFLASPALQVIDRITFGPQLTGISEGRLLDGSSNLVSFPQSPSPGAPNYLPLASIVINEVLTHSDPPLEDAIELFNPTTVPINIAGWWLSDSREKLYKFRIPANTPPLPPGGYAVFTESQFNNPAASVPFALNSVSGDELYLAAADPSGAPSGQRASVRFGPASSGVSFGKFRTSAGEEFIAQASRTFGSANAGPLVGPIVISEIQFHPPALPGQDEDFEYIRLQNISDRPVALYDEAIPTNTWHLRGAVDFSFPPSTILAARASLLLIGFNSKTEPDLLNDFRSLYGLDETMPIFGPYAGKLDNHGERLELTKPYNPLPPGLRSVPEVLVDSVDYRDSTPWPAGADGTGLSLHRVNPSAFGNEPANWAAGPSAVRNSRPVVALLGPADGSTLRPNQPIDLKAGAFDADGILKRVEFLVDDDRLGIGTASGTNYTFIWTNAPTGVHKLVARAIDNQLGVTDSSPVFFSVINRPATVALLSPARGASYSLPAIIELEAAAADADGAIAQVDFYASGILLASLTSPPYRYRWTNQNSGAFELVAAATDDLGAITTSESVSITAAHDVTIAYVVKAGTVGAQVYGNGLGMDFDVLTNIVVTRLGAFDSGSDGIKGAATLTTQLYTRRGNAGTLLATLTFTTADPGVLIGGSRFKPLPIPRVLAPGTYSIVSYGHDAQNPNGNLGSGNTRNWSTDDGGGLISFVGGSRYGGGNVGSFPPTVDGGPADRYAAGTFEFSRVLTPPQSLTALPASRQVLLTWDAVPGAGTYNIKRASSAAGPFILLASPSIHTYADSAVTSGETYFYVVSAANSATESADSSPVGVVYTEPAILSVNLLQSRAVQLSWSASLAYTLFTATNLTAPAAWLPVTNSAQINNNQKTIILPSDRPSQFFQLR